MKKHTIGGLFIAVILAASVITTPVTLIAQDKEKPATVSESKQPRPYPFSGKLGAVDKEKKTITIMGKEKSRTLHLDDQTKIVKNDKAATLDEAAVGNEVGGQLRKTDDGREVLVSLRLGAKPAAAAKPEKQKPAKDK